MDTPPVSIKKTCANSLTKNSFTPCRRVGLGRPSSRSLNKLISVRTDSTPSNGLAHGVDQSSLSAITQMKTNITPACESQLKVPFKENDGQNTVPTRVKRCLTQDVKTHEFQSVKRAMNESDVKSGSVLNEVRENCVRFVKESDTGSQVKKLKSECVSTKASKTLLEGLEHENKSFMCKTKSLKTLAKPKITDDSITELVISLIEKKKKLEQFRVQETYAKKHNLEELQAQTAKWKSAGQEALRHCMRLARQAGYSVTIPQLMEQHGFPPDLIGYNSEDDDFE